MVSVDAILDMLTSLHFNEYADPVAKLFMELDLEEIPSKDVQRKLCEAGMPAARARTVKTALTSRAAGTPAVQVRVLLMRFFASDRTFVLSQIEEEARRRQAETEAAAKVLSCLQWRCV